MIVLDTHVVSEALKPRPQAAVRTWLDEQAVETRYLASSTLTELRVGVALLPSGPRKERLASSLEVMLALFEGRVLPFDADAARRYAEIEGIAHKAGHGFRFLDAYIAAVAASHGFAVASRDAGPFAAAGLEVIDPWAA